MLKNRHFLILRQKKLVAEFEDINLIKRYDFLKIAKNMRTWVINEKPDPLIYFCVKQKNDPCNGLFDKSEHLHSIFPYETA